MSKAYEEVDVEQPQEEKRKKQSVFRYASGKDWCYQSVALMATIVSGANQPAQLVIFGQLLDSFNAATKSEAVKLVQFFALMYALVGVQQLITVTLQAWASTKSAASQSRTIRRAYLKALLKQPMAFFDTAQSGAATGAIEATRVIEDGLGEKFATGLQGVFSFAFGIGVALYYAWSLALLTVGALPLVALLVGTASKASEKASKIATEANSAKNSTALAALQHFRTVAAFSAQGRTVHGYRQSADRASHAKERLSVRIGLNSAAVAVCLYGTWGLGLWYGAYLIRKDQQSSDKCTFRDGRDPNRKCTTGGDVFVAFLCILFGGLSLLSALPGLAAFQAAQNRCQDLFKVIDSTSKVEEVVVNDDDDEGVEIKKGPVECEFRDVFFAYPSRPNRPVYDGSLNLRIEKGSTTALCGPSGGGKSTLISLILRFYDVTQGGTVVFDGVDVTQIPPKLLRSQIAYVQQEPLLFAGSITKNIRDGNLNATDAQIRKACVLANAHDFITELPDGYDTLVDGNSLSGGQRQRVCIARALVRDPRLLCLDEATSALDARSERVVQEALSLILQSHDRTTLVVAHRLSTVRKCDTIAVLVDGRVVESGTHDQLLERPDGHYRALVKTQEEVSVQVDEPEDTKKMITMNSTRDSLLSQISRIEDSPSPEEGPEKKKKKDDQGGNKESTIPAKEVLKWLYEEAKAERGFLTLGLLGSAVTGLAQPALGFVFSEFTSLFYETSLSDMRRKARFWAFMFAIMAVVVSLAELAKAYGLSRASERTSALIDVKAFKAMLQMDASWHDRRNPGELSARLNQDIEGLKGLLGPRTAQTVAAVVILVGGLGVSFEASWELTLVTVAIIPLIVLPIALTAMYVSKVSASAEKASDEASALASSSVVGIRTVRSLGMEEAILQRFDKALELPEKRSLEKGIATGIGGGCAAATILFGAAFQYYVASLFFREGWVEFDEIMRVLLVVIFLAFGLGGVAGDAVDKVEATNAARRVYEWCLLTPGVRDPESSVSLKKNTTDAVEISFIDVHFTYPTRPAAIFRGFSLTLKKGESTAVCGESGSGKSTLVQLLARYYDVSSGHIQIDGIDIRTMKLADLRKILAIVSQEPVLFEGTVADQIRYGCPEATDDQIIKACKLANAHDFISKLPNGYSTQLSSVSVSGGQKQRIAIARALVRQPRALILDEATSALDSQSEADVQQALDSLLLHQNLTTLCIAHRLSTIQNANTIAVVHQGALVESGTHEQLLALKGAYYALHLNAQGHDALAVAA